MDPTSPLDQLDFALSPSAQGILAGSIMLMMFAIALGLRRDQFAFLRAEPRFFWGGLSAQIIGLPLATILLCTLIQPPPSVALGMIVVAACPGGNVSNFMTYASRGDVAYSVSLTAASSLVAALWTPAAILLWSALYPPTAGLLQTIEFDRGAFILQTTLLLAAPLTVGMVAGHKWPAFAKHFRKPLALFGGGMMAFVIIHSVIGTWPELIANWRAILEPIALHNALAFALGFGAAAALRASAARERTLTFEVGIQNAGLAVVLLLSQLNGLGGAAVIAGAWGVWHFFSGGAMIVLFRTLDARKAKT